MLSLGIPLSGHAQTKHQDEIMASEAILAEIEKFVDLGPGGDSQCEKLEVAFCLTPSWQARIACKMRGKDVMPFIVVALDSTMCPECIVTGFVARSAYFYSSCERDGCTIWDFSYAYYVLRQSFPGWLP